MINRKKKPKSKAQKSPRKFATVTDAEFEFAREMIDRVIAPRLEKLVLALNERLAEEGIRAGLEIRWMFDKVVQK